MAARAITDASGDDSVRALAIARSTAAPIHAMSTMLNFLAFVTVLGKLPIWYARYDKGAIARFAGGKSANMPKLKSLSESYMISRYHIFPAMTFDSDTAFALPLSRVKMPEWVTQALSELIRSGLYLPGARLPSELQMARDYGVSRTVIREAVSRLKSEGLVESRQGSGVFVREAGADLAFRIAPRKVSAMEHVVHVAELRRSIESEIAALAAERATAEQIHAIGVQLAAIAADVANGGNGVAADIEFHRCIARATGNPHFLALWDFLSHFLSSTIKITRAMEAQKKDTADQVVAEHRAIYEAILVRDIDAARTAARAHIDMSVHRIRTVPFDFPHAHDVTAASALGLTPPA